MARATAYALPFADGAFDLVFTCGVLIHLTPDDLPRALAEIGRVSGRHVWIGEYHSECPVEIPYRGETGALFKRDFGAEFERCAANFRIAESGFLGKKETGYDDLTFWLLEKT